MLKLGLVFWQALSLSYQTSWKMQMYSIWAWVGFFTSTEILTGKSTTFYEDSQSVLMGNVVNWVNKFPRACWIDQEICILLLMDPCWQCLHIPGCTVLSFWWQHPCCHVSIHYANLQLLLCWRKHSDRWQKYLSSTPPEVGTRNQAEIGHGP